MRLLLLRHGKTAANLQRLYCGASDLPLCKEGTEEIARLVREGVYPAAPRAYATGLRRTAQTAQLIWPRLEPVPLPALRECAFGVFELHSYEQLRADPRYIDWISDETGSFVCPGGESRNGFYRRVGEGFADFLHTAADAAADTASAELFAAIVCHGGTICALLEQFCDEKRGYYDWQPAPGRGYLVEASFREGKPFLQVIGKI